MVQKEIQPCMTPGGRLLRKSTLTGDALYAALLLSLLGTWRNNIFLGLRVSTMTLTIPHGSSVTNVIPPFTCNVQPGSLKEWSEIKDFCAHSSFADNFKSVGVLCIAWFYFGRVWEGVLVLKVHYILQTSNNNSFETEYFTLGGCAGPQSPTGTNTQ